jgi:hypothetical protein
MCIRSFVLAVSCSTIAACDNSAFFGGTAAEEKPEVPPPAMAKPSPRPPECQAAMDLIAGCNVALEPTRISAVAECRKESYLGDTELQAFLRCLGDAPTCEQLVRCSGPIGSMGQATTTAAPSAAGGAQ